MTTLIAPVLFDAHPDGARGTDSDSLVECFNSGASGEDIASLTAPAPISRMMSLGYAAAALSGVLLFFGAFAIPVARLIARGVSRALAAGTLFDGMAPLLLASLGVGLVAAAFFVLALRKRKAWQKALGDAWFAHGGHITVLKDLSKATRDEVTPALRVLEDIRRGLNLLDPEGDELDDARYSIQRYIDVSDLPLLGQQALAAPHIEDPAVRRAAKEYEEALKYQMHARYDLDAKVDQADDVLKERRQAHNDAELIRRANELASGRRNESCPVESK